ncbi:MAG TPA: HAD family hydrolase [Candidatus Saccharimonadales bacterium]|nr:HAD family hydrolase [Candidatus Saccharimonadales bacterium]
MKKWYLDLDDTLYRTTYGYSEMCRAVSKLYDIKLMTFAIRMLRHRVKGGGSARGYLRFFKTLQSFGIDPTEARELIFKELIGKDFLYDDAREFLSWLDKHDSKPTIVTFGDPETQEFKISLLPELAEFEKVIVQQPKQIYLNNLPQHDAIIVDDKPVLDLPTWCSGVLLVRKLPAKDYNGQIVKSLKELINE